MAELLQVTVDFDRSHLIFPTLIGVILMLLGLAIALTHRRAIAGSGGMWSRAFAHMDKARFFGTLALTVIYFLLMVPVGNIWPNTGLGFLICSIPFVALTSILYMHERNGRSLIPAMIVAVVAPTLVWWLFTYVFALTLP
ncbi:tripartite tricarboxylate transporter TctB family protein [Paracoccus sediminicola]|uniref:tripartite tricarboxylate transporter TctB family protein n=1 Tax=Paracoccus sediminicola TaxID=3017783 RepID=UPI0022F0E91A|nr:tripartite tricarboxylate transporter TctB family protein [Paracoccus sediminicola]WBU56082.1 tripartite tricarboxylate transporter TctB family protein [Paracoccus sediminicola]